MDQAFETDVVETAQGELAMAFLGHGSLLFTFGGKRIYVDPFSRVADYSRLPKADLVLLTHEHRDHLDPAALGAIRTPATLVVAPPPCAEALGECRVLRNGESTTLLGVEIEAVPAYNLVHKRESGEPFHPRGRGNGYVLTFGGVRVLVAGDTENVPELKALRGVEVAFLPMNLPYTMTPEMVADLARALRPKILYPYHYGSTDPQALVALLRDEPGIEVRIRKLA
ncbi:MAG: MBL fold metallo-hydrolase [Candidatus Bipolaricaulota bacterium]|nr:MBL fold metallo-hydrolase [Candidatus Bipolaricaulota bacterium]